MGPSEGAEQAGLGEGARVTAVGLDRAPALRVHRGEVGVGDDDLVTQRLEAPRHPLALRRRLDENARRGPASEGVGESPWLGAEAAFEQLTVLCQDAELTLLLVDIDANMIHGWPPTRCGFDRVFAVWGDSTPPR